MRRQRACPSSEQVVGHVSLADQRGPEICPGPAPPHPLVTDIGDRQEPPQPAVHDPIGRGLGVDEFGDHLPGHRLVVVGDVACRPGIGEHRVVADVDRCPAVENRAEFLDDLAVAEGSGHRHPTHGVVELVALVRARWHSCFEVTAGEARRIASQPTGLGVKRAGVGARGVEHRGRDRHRLLGPAAQAQHVGVQADDELVDRRRRVADRHRLDRGHRGDCIAFQRGGHGPHRSAKETQHWFVVCAGQRSRPLVDGAQSSKIAAHVGDGHPEDQGDNRSGVIAIGKVAVDHRVELAVEARVVVVAGMAEGDLEDAHVSGGPCRLRGTGQPARRRVDRQCPRRFVDKLSAGQPQHPGVTPPQRAPTGSQRLPAPLEQLEGALSHADAVVDGEDPFDCFLPQVVDAVPPVSVATHEWNIGGDHVQACVDEWVGSAVARPSDPRHVAGRAPAERGEGKQEAPRRAGEPSDDLLPQELGRRALGGGQGQPHEGRPPGELPET